MLANPPDAWRPMSRNVRKGQAPQGLLSEVTGRGSFLTTLPAADSAEHNEFELFQSL